MFYILVSKGHGVFAAISVQNSQGTMLLTFAERSQAKTYAKKYMTFPYAILKINIRDFA